MKRIEDFDFHITQGLLAQRSAKLLERIEQFLAWEEFLRDRLGEKEEQRSDTDRGLDVECAIEAVALIRSLSKNPYVPWQHVSLIWGWVLAAITVPWSRGLLEHILSEIAVADAKHKDEPWEDAWWIYARDVRAELEASRRVILLR